MYRAAHTLLAATAVLCVTSHALAWDVDLTDKPEASWHAYVGKIVTMSGTYVRFAKFGPAVTAGKGYLYIMQWQPGIRWIDDGLPVLVEGRLRYQPPKPARPHSTSTPGFFYILHRESGIRLPVM